MQTPLLNPPSLISTRHRPRPPVDGRHPSSTQTPTPSCRGTARALHAASAVAMPIMDAHLGLDSTDHIWTRRLAVELLCTYLINSTGSRHPGPTAYRSPTMPTQRHRAAQHAQSVQHVPVHLHVAWPRSAPEPARQHATSTTPPLPSLLEHAHDRAEPESDRTPTETTRVPTEPRSHRRNRSNPYT
jgi:hypothetical protein